MVTKKIIGIKTFLTLHEFKNICIIASHDTI